MNTDQKSTNVFHSKITDHTYEAFGSKYNDLQDIL